MDDKEDRRAAAEVLRQESELARARAETARMAAEDSRAVAEEGRQAAATEVAHTVATLTEVLDRMEVAERMRRASRRDEGE